MRTRTAMLAALAALQLCACAAIPGGPNWAGRLPNGADLGNAALTAARSPATWVPLVAAAVLGISDQDDRLSDWAADETPLFGSHAASVSDDLRDVGIAAYYLTALATPSDGALARGGGLAVGISTMVLEDGVIRGLKDLTKRKRPDGSNDKSFPSGHAGMAATSTTLARRNLDYLDLPPWVDGSLRVGLYGVAVGTAWARVEAERHHVTDVLAGHAVGNFIASFMHAAFMASALPPMRVEYQPVAHGGALTLTIALGR